MQVQKVLVVVLSLSLTGAIHAQQQSGDSTEARLREAMRRKIAEDRGGNTPPQSTPVTPNAPVAPAAPSAPSKAPVQPMAPAAVQTPGTPGKFQLVPDMPKSQEDMLRDSGRQKMADDAAMKKAEKAAKKKKKQKEEPKMPAMAVTAPAVTPTAPEVSATTPPPIVVSGAYVPPGVVPVPPANLSASTVPVKSGAAAVPVHVFHDPTETPVPVVADQTQEAKMRAATRNTIAQEVAMEKANKKPTKMAKLFGSSSSEADFQPGEIGDTPMIPAVPLTPKEMELAKLLELYKADRITPVEYHAQRVKILAAP